MKDSRKENIFHGRHFAEMSGDYNPLHVNLNYPKITVYGQPVVHGMNLVILALKYLAVQQKRSWFIKQISASFVKPAFYNEEIVLDISNTSDDNHFQIKIHNAARTVLLSDIRIQIDKDVTKVPPYNCGVTQFSSHYDDIEIESIAKISGNEPLLFGKHLASQHWQLAAFGSYVPEVQLAELLALTRIIGMKAPGRRALFDGFRLEFDLQKKTGVDYKVTRVKEKINLFSLRVSGPTLSGSAKVSYVPEPPKPKYSYEQIKEIVDLDPQQTPLVVAGTGGLGEMTVKVLAAAGVNPVFTCRDLDAGRRIEKETDGAAEAVLVRTNKDIDELVKKKHFSHLYFFPSPRIFDRSTDAFDVDRLKKFTSVYIKLLEEYLERLSGVTVLIPSTVALETKPAGMAEYIAAKAATEAWCDFYAKNRDDTYFHIVRLPRIETSQTASNFVTADEPLEHVINFVKLMG